MVDQNTQFYAILTNVGAAKQANADALGIAWKITQMGVGDANGTDPTPNATQKSLINEWRRAPLNQLKVDDNDASIIVAEQVIPADIGGKWIREIGLYDSDGDLVAVANCAPTYKPVLSQGSGRTQVLRMSLVVSSAANVQLKIDPSVVLATREWVTEELLRQDFKHSVLVATTTNITLGGLGTVDGVTLAAGDRVLVKNQTAAKDNGVYTVVSGGAWTRSADANSSAKVTPGLLVLVEKGTANSDSAWQLVTDAPISLGVTALSFEMAFGRTGVAAGTYRSVQVDKYGRVVAATNPTTVAGYGITDVYTKSETYTKTETNQAITTAVDAAVRGLVASAPGALDTLDELAAALGDDANFSVTMLNKLAEKAPLASPKFTGSPEVPTPTAGSTGLQAANMSALATAVAAASRAFKSAVIGVATSITLTAAQAGNAVQFNTGPVTVTLPAVADVGNGASFMLRNPSTTATQTLNVVASGSLVDAGSTVTSMAIKPSEWLEVAASGTSWFVLGRGKLKEVAELDSPVFTGSPKVPTAPLTDSSQLAANTEFVKLLIKAYGLGERYAGVITDIDDPTLGNGWYAVTLATTAGNKPTGQTWGTVFVAGRSNTTGANGRVVQTFFATDSATARQLFRTYFNGGWTAWEDVATLTAVQNALAAVGLGVTGTPPTLADVDAATTPTGLYRVAAPTGTLPAGVSRNGTVFVERYAAANIRQTFSPVGGGEGKEFSRTLGSAGSWLVWEESAKVASPTFTGNVGVPTRSTADRSANAASTQFVANLLASLGLGTADLTDLETGVDLNTLNVGGSYQVNGALNAPAGYGGVLFVVGCNSQYWAHQLMFPQSVNKIFHRCSYGATNGVANWKDWEEVPDLTTVTALIKASRRYFSGDVVGVAASTALTAAQTGYAFNVTAAVTVTLPAAAAAGSGGTFSLRNVSSGNVTIALASGQIYEKNAAASTAVLKPGEWVEVQASAANYFINARGKLGEVAELDSPAFTGTPSGTTPPTGDVSKRFATTEFVELTKRNFAGPVLGFTANTTLTVAQSGRLYQANAANLTVTLPAAADAPAGTAYAFRNTSGGTLTIAPASGTIVSTVTATTLVLQPGEYVEVANNATTSWFVAMRGKLDESPTVAAMNAAVTNAAPPGMVAHFALATPPTGWIKRNGAAVSRTAYAVLFAAIGTTFGAGDGSTTFNVPDDRELIDRAHTDGLNSADAGRVLFSTQAGQLESHAHTGTVAAGGSHSHTAPIPRERIGSDSQETGGNAVLGDLVGDGYQTITTSTAANHTHGLTINATGGNETRMANRAYLACIKY